MKTRECAVKTLASFFLLISFSSLFSFPFLLLSFSFPFLSFPSPPFLLLFLLLSFPSFPSSFFVRIFSSSLPPSIPYFTIPPGLSGSYLLLFSPLPCTLLPSLQLFLPFSPLPPSFTSLSLPALPSFSPLLIFSSFLPCSLRSEKRNICSFTKKVSFHRKI